MDIIIWLIQEENSSNQINFAKASTDRKQDWKNWIFLKRDFWEGRELSFHNNCLWPPPKPQFKNICYSSWKHDWNNTSNPNKHWDCIFVATLTAWQIQRSWETRKILTCSLTLDSIFQTCPLCFLLYGAIADFVLSTLAWICPLALLPTFKKKHSKTPVSNKDW